MAALAVVSVLAGLFILFARQITIGPFDEEGAPTAVFITEYRACLGPADRVDSKGSPITTLGAMLRRDRENVARGITQPGDEVDSGSDGRAWLTTAERLGQLEAADISSPADLQARIAAGEEPLLRVLLHQEDEGWQMLVGISEVSGDYR